MDLLCPSCRSPLATGIPAWDCPGCGQSYRALRGIPDLRTAQDVYLDNRADWTFAKALDRVYDRVDFRGLLKAYFDLATEVAPSQRARQIDHILTAPGRAGQWAGRLGPAARSGVVLDLGCGSGSFLAARAGEFRSCWGVDIAMRWLLLAKKRLEEDGLEGVPLACGCAEDLPFPDGSFSAIVAGDVIEHVRDQDATIAEAHRLLRPGGKLLLATPNRFSLAPEPHVGVWGVGYLPRRWMARYVQFTSKKDFLAIHTSGIGEWRRRVARSPFREARIAAPGLPNTDLGRFGPFKKVLAQSYNQLVGSRPGRWAALRVGPLFHIEMEKSADAPSRPPNPATRRRSTRPGVTR